VAPLARGVALARDRFLAALQKAGVERLELNGTPFDPNVAEAVRLVPVDSPEDDGAVVETMRPGYVLGERIIRPARVAVGRHGD
jgi:molecular chaperone GrpE (heat shock protein)